jgi:hypothetical protein
MVTRHNSKALADPGMKRNRTMGFSVRDAAFRM